MITRIITVGPQRLGNLLLTLHFDCYLDPKPDHSIIITPLDPNAVKTIIRDRFPALDFQVYADDAIVDIYPDIEHWTDYNNFRAGWLRQQALKLAAIDYFDSEIFLIQDPDTFCIEPYGYYLDSDVNLLVLPGQYHYDGYYNTLETVLRIPRQTTASFVTELMPLLAQDWLSCKNQIESTINQPWLKLIDHVPFETITPTRQVRWFSEYELLGNWITYLREPATTVQKRFVFNSLDTLNDLNTNYNAVCDRGINGQVKGRPSLFSNELDVNYHNIDQALTILRSKKLC